MSYRISPSFVSVFSVFRPTIRSLLSLLVCPESIGTLLTRTSPYINSTISLTGILLNSVTVFDKIKAKIVL